MRRLSRESAARTSNTSPIARRSQTTFPSASTVAPKPPAKGPESAVTICHRLADSAMQRNRPNSNARGASSSRRCARSTTDSGGRAPRAARRCRRPFGSRCGVGPVAPAGHAVRGVIGAPRRFSGRARTSDRHAARPAPPEAHDLPTCRSGSTAPRPTEDLTDVCTEPLHRTSAPPDRLASTRRHALGPEHRNQVGASARYVQPVGVAERAPTGQSVRVKFRTRSSPSTAIGCPGRISSLVHARVRRGRDCTLDS
jgi:hypothetical protein